MAKTWRENTESYEGIQCSILNTANFVKLLPYIYSCIMVTCLDSSTWIFAWLSYFSDGFPAHSFPIPLSFTISHTQLLRPKPLVLIPEWLSFLHIQSMTKSCQPTLKKCPESVCFCLYWFLHNSFSHHSCLPGYSELLSRHGTPILGPTRSTQPQGNPSWDTPTLYFILIFFPATVF